MKKIAVLVSHTGTNFQAMIDACNRGKIDAEIVIAISNNSQSEGLKRASRANIEAVHLSSSTHPNPHDLDVAMSTIFENRNVDLIVTAGYMKKLGLITLRNFSGKILNVHPSLLPKYGGRGMFGINVHKAVIESGDSESGITVHWLDEQYDTGPIIAQQKVSVFDGDTPESLAKRILVEEHKLLVTTLAKLTKDGEN